jgi:hypothetical protein
MAESGSPPLLQLVGKGSWFWHECYAGVEKVCPYTSGRRMKVSGLSPKTVLILTSTKAGGENYNFGSHELYDF